MHSNRVEIVEVAENQKTVLRQLMELYEYDFSEYNGADVNEHGHYGYKYLDHYWTEDKRSAYFVKVDDRYAGFVLVNAHCYLASQEDDCRAIAEFFIMRKYRRQGVGKQAAFAVFGKHAGSWEVLQHGKNLPSHVFWRNTVHDYTSGNYTEHEVTTANWTGKGLYFTTPEPQ